MSTVSRFVKLSPGYDCPILGYGTFQSKDAQQLKVALKAAMEAGYRHIDTARIYCNETVIGETLQELFQAGVVKREDIFLTTKLHMSFMKRGLVVDALKKQLEMLKMDYVDLYLIHFPTAMQISEGNTFPIAEGKVLIDPDVKVEETWAGMEECVQLGLARSIGVSNFNISQLERVLHSGTIKPAVNQIESHPGFQNRKNIDFCHSKGIAVMAYSQFGSPGTIVARTGKPLVDLKLLEDERLLKIGAKYGKNAAQVILRWYIQRGIVVIPKSTTAFRIVENFDVWNFELSDEDVKTVEAMDKNSRFVWMDAPGIIDHPEYPHKEAGSC